jgi:hypothetical protein
LAAKAIKAPKVPIYELLWLFGQSEKAAKAETKAQTNRAYMSVLFGIAGSFKKTLGIIQNNFGSQFTFFLYLCIIRHCRDF